MNKCSLIWVKTTAEGTGWGASIQGREMDSLLCRVGGVLGSPVERDRMQADGFSRHLTCDPGGAKGDGCLIQMTRAPESVVWVKQRQVRRRSLKSEPTI